MEKDLGALMDAMLNMSSVPFAAEKADGTLVLH